jgi:hypothetical protein
MIRSAVHINTVHLLYNRIYNRIEVNIFIYPPTNYIAHMTDKHCMYMIL